MVPLLSYPTTLKSCGGSSSALSGFTTGDSLGMLEIRHISSAKERIVTKESGCENEKVDWQDSVSHWDSRLAICQAVGRH